MMLQELVYRRTLMSLAWRCHIRQIVPAWQHFKGSRFISVSVDDREEESAIRNFLVYERLKNFERHGQNARHIHNVAVKENIINPVIRFSKPINHANLDVNLKKQNSKSHKVRTRTIAEQLNSRFSNQPEILELMKLVRNCYSCYIVKQDAADTLLKHLKKDLTEGDIIAEADPGPGILTKSLLEQTHCKIVSYEQNDMFRANLMDKLKNFGPLHMESVNLLKFYSYYITSFKESLNDGFSDKLHTLLKPLPGMNEEGVSSVKIVGSVTQGTLFRTLALSYSLQCCLFEDIYPDMYIYVPDIIYKHLISSSECMYSRILKVPFIYYFEIEHLDTVPTVWFYSRNFLQSKPRSILSKTKNFVLLKISPKKTIHELVPREELPSLHYFMHYMNGPKKHESFILYLEKFIPGCGIEFIKSGFSAFDQPRQISSERLLAAFKLFRSLPMYKESLFHELCTNWIARMGTTKTEEAPQLGIGDMACNDADFSVSAADNEDESYQEAEKNNLRGFSG